MSFVVKKLEFSAGWRKLVIVQMQVRLAETKGHRGLKATGLSMQQSFKFMNRVSHYNISAELDFRL